MAKHNSFGEGNTDGASFSMQSHQESAYSDNKNF